MNNEALIHPDWLFLPASTPSQDAIDRATARQQTLTKPPGSLGPLEEIAVLLAGLQATATPSIANPHIILFAGDHGITAEGVSAFPSDVTAQMLDNFVRGGAAISVLARQLEAALHVVDVGTMATEIAEGVRHDKIAHGSRNFRREPALSRAQVIHALDAGRRAALYSVEAGADFLIFGEMGIGNTSSASAIAAALTNCSVGDLVGAGTGLDRQRIAHKTKVVHDSLAFHRIDAQNNLPLDVLEKVGGHEIAALAGGFISAAQARTPVLVDGFICTAAALAAVRLNPSVRDWLIFSHRSAEPGHTVLLAALDAHPLLDLGLRLGEGSGAALALPLLRLACALHNEMATFEDAGVSTAP